VTTTELRDYTIAPGALEQFEAVDLSR